ncbi:MAG: hypothetical protein AAFX78_10700 [Cyanobacteria bacterium J06638_20]
MANLPQILSRNGPVATEASSAKTIAQTRSPNFWNDRKPPSTAAQNALA